MFLTEKLFFGVGCGTGTGGCNLDSHEEICLAVEFVYLPLSKFIR